ncbi:MAG: hypothetical protein LLG20_18430 [Acidobacteriales bacterium]|nr:hypothetical protein [Terriglobales bacterium]
MDVPRPRSERERQIEMTTLLSERKALSDLASRATRCRDPWTEFYRGLMADLDKHIESFKNA